MTNTHTPSERAIACPFCNCYPAVEQWGGRNEYMVKCVGQECDVLPKVIAPTRLKAIAAWNRRDAGREEVVSALCAPTGQPARAWTAREKHDLSEAMQRITEREALASPAPESVREDAALIDSVRGFLDCLPAHYCPPNRRAAQHIGDMKRRLAAIDAARGAGGEG